MPPREMSTGTKWIFGIVICGAVFTFVHFLTDKPKSTQPVVRRYQPTMICDDAYDKNYNFLNSRENHFDITLHEGCFGGWVYTPSSWKYWRSDAAGETKDFWVAYWFENDESPLGPFAANDQTNFKKPLKLPFRLQGHGTIRFYTNVVSSLGTSAEPDAPNSPPEIGSVSHISVRNDDPHLCDKAPNAYYAHLGMVLNAGTQPPVFLFDSIHTGDEVNWAGKFNGTVPVCLVIDQKGNPSDIVFPQPPGKELEDHIRQMIDAWHFSPGYMQYSDTKEPVSSELLYNISIQPK